MSNIIGMGSLLYNKSITTKDFVIVQNRIVALINTPNGKKSIKELSEEFGISPNTLRNRLANNWPYKLLIDPKARKSPIKLIDTPLGKISMKEAVKASGIAETCLVARIRRGWAPEDLFKPSIPRK